MKTKKLSRLLSIVFLVLLLIFCVGCGSNDDEDIENTGNGEITENNDDGNEDIGGGESNDEGENGDASDDGNSEDDENNDSDESGVIKLTAHSSIRAKFIKNGETFYNRYGGGGGGRGFNIAVLDDITGELIEPPRNYDTYSGKSATGAALADYINFDVPEGAIIMITVGDSAGDYGIALKNALSDLGATQASNIGWRNTWAMIVIKGGDVLDEIRSNGQWTEVNATATITLELEDPHGDTMDTATQLQLNNAAFGYLHEGESDMFKFSLSHDGILTLSNSKADSVLTILLNSSGQAIASSLDYQQFEDKSIKTYLEAGIYYIEVSNLNDAPAEIFVQKLRYVIDPPLPEEITFTAQSSIRAIFTLNNVDFYNRYGGGGGGRGFNIAVVDPSTGSILVVGRNYDTWGRGTTAGNELSAYINSLEDGVMLLLAVGDSAGNYGTALKNTLSDLGATQASNIGWRNTWAMIVIKGGDVLDEVRSNGHWSVVTAAASITVPGHDIAGENSNEAVALEVDSFTPSYLHGNDVDTYRFSLANPESVWLESKGGVDTVVCLYTLDESGNIVIYATEEQGGSGNNFLLRESLSAGTYYIEITGSTGQYDLILMKD